MTQVAPRQTPAPEPRVDGLAARVRLGRVFRPVSTEFALIASTSLLLTVFGLVMILSASSANAVDQGQGPFSIVLTQALVAAVGVPLMFLMSRFPVQFWKRTAWLVLILAVGLQMLVYTPLGYENDGNTNWLKIGSQVIQPSEFIKLALAVWAGFILWRKQELLSRWKHVFVPLIPVGFLAIAAVLGGKDLGTSMVLFLIILGALFFSGVRLRLFILPLLISVVAVLGFAFADEHLIGATTASAIHTIALAVVACVIVWKAFSVRARLWAVVLGALLGGVLGNLTDRIFRAPGFGVGHVVDMISMPWMLPAIFNVADIFIVCGMISIALLIIVGLRLDGTRERDHKDESTSEATEDGEAEAPAVEGVPADDAATSAEPQRSARRDGAGSED